MRTITSGIIDLGNINNDFEALINNLVKTLERIYDLVEVSPNGGLSIPGSYAQYLDKEVLFFNNKAGSVGKYYKGSLKNLDADKLFKGVVFRLEYLMKGSGEFRSKPQYKDVGSSKVIIPGEIMLNPISILGSSLDSDFELDLSKLRLKITEVIHHELHHAAEWSYYQSKGDYSGRVTDATEDWGYNFKNINIDKLNKSDKFIQKLIKDRKKYPKEIDYNNNFTELRAYVISAYYSIMQHIYSNKLYKKEEGYVLIYRKDMVDFLKSEDYYIKLTSNNKNIFLKNLLALLKKKKIEVI